MAKQYTAAQWARIQARLPEEDRVPYSESPDKLTPAEQAAAAFPNTMSAIDAARAQSTVATGAIAEAQAKLGDVYAARAAAAEAAAAKAANTTPPPPPPADDAAAAAAAAKAAEEARLKAALDAVNKGTATVLSVTYEGKGKNRVKVTTYTNGVVSRVADPEADSPTPKTVVSVTYEGTGKNRVKVTKYSDNTETRESAPEEEPKKTVTRTEIMGSGANRFIRTYYSDNTYVDTPSPDTTDTGVGSSDTDFANLLKGFQNQNNALLAQIAAQQAQAQIDAAKAAEEAKQLQAKNALVSLTDRFTKYGLASLVPKIRELAISGASEDTIALQLQETEEYKQRFIANQERLKKGLRVLDPGSYIGLEDRYRQILRAYGLKQFDTDSYVTQFLANDTSPEELSSRVVTAVQRVQNADPALIRTLKDFYGIGTTDMVAYVLDPTNQFPKIERQVAAAEIGTAARRQGIEAGVGVSEQLAAQGITEAEARRGYSTIADILPQATKLSAIYTDVLDQYGQAEAEQEVFNSLASAQRKRQKLIEREAAAFAGQTGLGRTSLTQQTGGTI